MKIKATIHIHFQKYAWETEGTYLLFSQPFDDSEYRAYIGPQEVEIEVPDNFDPRAQQVAALEKQRQKVMADYQQTVNEINDRISNLQAITYTA